MTDLLASQLKAGGYSLSRPRRQIFDYLARRGATSASGIVAELSGQMDRSSVFRVIKLFRSLGIIHDVGVGPRRKVELADWFSPHHHHMTCRECGRAVSFSSDSTERLLRRVAAGHGFQLKEHHLELTGLCRACS
jgi:Fur family transcriptional regulator, ferric uptake regulator